MRQMLLNIPSIIKIFRSFKQRSIIYFWYKMLETCHELLKRYQCDYENDIDLFIFQCQKKKL